MSTDKEFLDGDFDFSDEFDSSGKSKEQKSEEPYHIELEEQPKTGKKEKPKYEGKKDVVSVQKKKKSDTEKAQTKLISISAKNRKVLEILKNIRNYPSESDFICQAIIEKYEREQTGKSSDLKDAVKEILEDMIGENFIIMKSSSDMINIPVNNTPITTQEQPVKEEPQDNDNADLIRGVMDMWDDE